jgi:hypothetical protein
MNVGLVGLLLGASFASGINLYATAATLGLLHRFEVVVLPPSIQVLAHPIVLGIALAFYVVEFVADKVPAVDHVWDAIHTFVRPPAAALLAYAAVSPTPVPELWRFVAALIAGGIALTAHSTKAATRGAVDASPEPFSRIALSFGEDLLAIGLSWLAVVHPVVAVAVVALLLAVSIALLVVLVRFARGLWRRMFRRGRPSDKKPAPA